MELKGISIENTNNPKIAEDSFVFVLHKRQPARADNKIINITLTEDKNTVLMKLLI
jgi:hypothetical protein